MMSVDSPEFNRITNDRILREWDAMAAAPAGRRRGDSKEPHDPETRVVSWKRSTQGKFGTLRGLIRAISSAFASRIDLTSTGYAAPRPAVLPAKDSLDADRT